MILSQIIINFTLFFVSFLSILVGRLSYISYLIAIEIMYLSITFNFVCMSVYFGEVQGFIFTIFILTVAAVEAAIGLIMLILYQRYNSTFEIFDEDAVNRD